MRFRWGVALTLSFMLLAVVGCGGGGGGDEASGSASASSGLTKAELIKKGEAICSHINGIIEKFEKTNFSDYEKADAAAGANIGRYQDLKELGVPEEEGGYAELMAAGEELKLRERVVDFASEARERAKMRALEPKAAAALDSFREEAREYGLEECANAPDLPVLKPSS